jgi:hypothetical protein
MLIKIVKHFLQNLVLQRVGSKARRHGGHVFKVLDVRALTVRASMRG